MADADLATVAATERAKQFKEASDKVRERSDAAAKALAALGTTGLTAVGIAKFSDVFPVPPGQGAWIAAVVVGFVAMTVVTAAFTFRMLKANRPFVTSPNVQSLDADLKEKKQVNRIYTAAARRNGLKSLRAYDARGERFMRLADRRADQASATKLKVIAERIRAESEAVQARAALVISRRRMTNALKGPPAFFFALIFLAGLFAFGLGADRLDSERTARLAAYKACADAATAKVVTLPPICKGAVAPPETPAATPDQARAQNLETLGTVYKACVDSAVKAKQPVSMCDGIRVQVAAAAK